MRDTKKKVLIVIGLLIFCVIIILPPILYDYSYPNIGDDSAEHLRIMDEMAKNQLTPLGGMYLGFSIIGYPMIFVHNITGVDIDSLYLWFTYSALILSGLTIFFVISRLVNRQAGWISLIMTIFCAQGLMFLFYYGVVFNIINIGIILPLFIYFAVMYIDEKRKKYLILMVCFALLFTVFHTTGIYLPAVMIGIMIAYMCYGKMESKLISIKHVLVWSAIAVGSLLLLWYFVPDVHVVMKSIFTTIKVKTPVPIYEYIGVIVSMSVMILIVVVAILSKGIWKQMKNKSKVLLCILGSLTVLLAVSAFTKIAGDPWRQALDLATMISLVVSVMIGVYLVNVKNIIVWVYVLGVIGVSLFHNIPTWFNYNSAITRADMDAIEYVNSLDYLNYNCSIEIAPWIYGRLLEAENTDEDCGLLIVRNYPMTPRTTVGNMWFINDRNIYTIDNTYEVLKVFRDDEITVQVAVK